MSTASVFHFSMKLSSCAWAAAVSVSEMARTPSEPRSTPAASSAGATVDSMRPSLSSRGEHCDLPAVQLAFTFEQRDDHVDPALGRDVGREQQAGWRVVDPGLRHAVGDRHALVIARDAQLRVAGEVDEDAHDREDIVVFGRGGADAQRARLAPRDRAVRLEQRLDHASVDAAVLVDVVEVRLVDLVLIDAHVVDEVLDASEVDERDRDLDRIRRDAGPELARRFARLRRPTPAPRSRNPSSSHRRRRHRTPRT